MKRATVLNWVRFAGYHNDVKAGTRIFVENRISKAAYDAAFTEGRRQRANGIKCGCQDCATASP